MPEPLILVLGLAVTGALVLAPLWREGRSLPDEDLDAAALRHRVALEAIRDVEADRRAGSLDEAAYAEQLADAEARAAATSAALEEPPRRAAPPALRPTGRSRAVMLASAAVIATLLVVGAAVPGTGVGNSTVQNEALAAAQRSEAERQADIRRLLEDVADDPTDVDALSDLADAYLAGSTEEDLVRGAVALRLLIDLDPGRTDAYERIITAYIRAGDYANARAALEGYEALADADPAEVAFFDGLIALRGEEDRPAAVKAFDRFLELAPDDGRAGMVRGLREEASAP